MGSHLVRRLAGSGLTVVAFDRDAAAVSCARGGAAHPGRRVAARPRKIAQQVLSRAFAGGFATHLMVKDLETAMDLARHTDTPVPVSAACMQEWKAALDEVGGQVDHTAIAHYIENRAGVTLEPHTPKGTEE